MAALACTLQANPAAAASCLTAALLLLLLLLVALAVCWLVLMRHSMRKETAAFAAGSRLG